MKYTYILILIIIVFSCKTKNKQESENQNIKIDNPELIEICKNDQNDRKNYNITWLEIVKKDSLRRKRVDIILNSNKIKTAKDYMNAAMVFKRGNDSINFLKTITLMKEAIKLDSTINKLPLAEITDRYLLSIGDPQIYGTQFYKEAYNKPWVLAKIDTTKITDKERVQFGVETLEKLRDKLKHMNGVDHKHDH
ncbi:hypothetical protein [Tenacibaculum ovolyticum]|uniref:hypothetical protein n=1 Tax=Tenacibaculum ovolyticum TaxID=104270 RepID=UPI00040B4A2B|nr:hypothetical protein [Tenacibaculum ovolyticum]